MRTALEGGEGGKFDARAVGREGEGGGGSMKQNVQERGESECFVFTYFTYFYSYLFVFSYLRAGSWEPLISTVRRKSIR